MNTTNKEIQEKLQIESHVLSAQLQNIGDQTSREITATVQVQVHNKMKVKLASIERALSRLQSGTYGICQICGKEIDYARINALPWAEQCIECQRSLERKTVHKYTYAYS